MKIDLHMHTSRHSMCGESTPEQMFLGALRGGMDGIVLTEHEYRWTEEEVRPFRMNHPELVILRAVEVSCDEGHILLYGDPGELNVERIWPMEELLEITRGESFFRVVAHPFRYEKTREHFDFLKSLPIDGVEISSNNTDAEANAMAVELAEMTGKVKIAASDAHSEHIAGLYYSIFDDEIATEDELVTALHAGRCRPSHDIVVHV